MVSLTFDEFHAIRSRQRAAAEAEASAADSAKASTDEPAHSTEPSVAAAAALAATSNGRSSSQFSPSAAASPAMSRSRRDGTSDDGVAPTSGSVIRKKRPQQPQQPAKKGLTTGWGGAPGMGSVANLGSFVELYEVQVAVVAVIYLDLVASTAQLLPYLQVADGGAREGAGGVAGVAEGSAGAGFGAFVQHLMSRLIQSFTGFTVIFFAMEVIMLLAAFRGKFFRHLGYVVDLLVVSACLYQELAGKGKGVRLLGALRVWRVARVMNTLLLSANEAHDQTRDTLRQAEKSTQDLEADRRRLQETLRREVEARKRVDRMLRGYKDEVETLNEALKIAAMDIAAAGVSPGMDMGDEDKKQNRPGAPVDSETASSTGSSVSGGSYESADAADKTRTPPGRQQASPGGSASRIFVFQDGTFQAR